MTPSSTRSSLAFALVATATGAAHAQTVSHPYAGLTLVQDSTSALVAADLCHAGVHVRATTYGERDELASSWATRVGARVAINGDLFTYGSYATDGRSRGNGVSWPAAAQFVQASRHEYRQYWQFGPRFAQLIENSMTTPSAAAREIVGGHNVIIRGGRATDPGGKPLLVNAYRHTAIGLSADHRTLFVLAVNSSVTATQLANRMISLASHAGSARVDVATNMDGGGSTQMYVAGHGLIIPSTRPVANHLGIFAGGGEAPANCTPAYEAQFVAQSFPSSSAAPIELTVGDHLDGWFEMRNTGTATWHHAMTRLAPTPRDHASPIGGPGWLSATRVSAVPSDVAPGATVRFPARLTGLRVGDFTQTFGLVEDGVTWFSQAPLGGGPADTLLRVHVVVRAPVIHDAGVMDASHGDGAVADASLDGADPTDATTGDTDGGDAREDAGARADGGDAGEGGETGDGETGDGEDGEAMQGCACTAAGHTRGHGAGDAAMGLALIVGATRRRRRDR